MCPRHLLRNGQKKVGGFAGLTGGVKDRAVVVLQDCQPIGQIIGMADLRDDPQMGAKKGAGQFGNEFFAGIGVEPKRPVRSRASRVGWAVQCPSSCSAVQ